MGHPLWPLYDLRLHTPALELRVPTEDELVARWEDHRYCEVEVDGLDSCRNMFGA